MTAVEAEGAAEVPHASDAGRYDAFISYARHDSAFVTNGLCEPLRARGLNVWLDLDITGGAMWRERAMRAIEACKALIFVVSPASLASDACRSELEDATALNKLIIPVIYRDDYQTPLPSSLADPEWVLLRAGDDYSRGIDRLVEALADDLEWRDQHTRLAGRAREWLDSGRDASYLLRGSDLRGAETWMSQQDGHRESPTREHRDYITKSRQAATRRQYTLIGALSIALAITIVLAVTAIVERNNAVHQTNIARSQLLASKADYHLAVEHSTRIPSLLSLNAYSIQHTPQALSAMLSVAGTREIGPPLVGVDHYNGLAYHPNGSVIAAASETGIDLWSTSFRGEPFDFNRSSIADYGLNWRGPSAVAGTGVSFSPDGRLVAVSAEDGTVQVFEVDQLLSHHRQDVVILETSSSRATAVAWNAAGSILAAGDANGNVHFWRPDTLLALAAQARERTPPFQLGGPGTVVQTSLGSVGALAFAPSRDTLGIGCKNGISLIDGRAYRTVATSSVSNVSVTALGWAPSGQAFASGGADGEIRLWDATNGQTTATLSTDGRPVTSLGYVDDSSLISGGSDGTLRDWNTARGYETDRSPILTSAPVVALAVAPDRKTVATATSDQHIDFWTSTDRRQLDAPRDLTAPLSLATLSADGRTLVVVTETGRMEIWREGLRDILNTLTPPPTRIDALALNRDGSMLAAGGDDGVIRLWTLPGGALFKFISVGDGGVRALAFSADGTRLASGTGTEAQLWRLPNGGKDGSALLGVVEPVTSLAFSADGATLAVAADFVALWHLSSRREFSRPLPVPGKPAAAGVTVVFSPTTPNVLAVASTDGLQLWDTQAERPLSSLFNGASPLAFTVDGTQLVSAAPRGLQLWDVSSAAQLGSVLPNSGTASALSFDPEGKLTSVSNEGAATVWDLSVSHLQRVLCALGQPLPSDTEWNYLAAGIPFKNTC